MKISKGKMTIVWLYFRPLNWTCQLFGISLISLPLTKGLRFLEVCYSLIHLTFSVGYTFYCITYVPSGLGHRTAVSVSVQTIQQIMGAAVLLPIYLQAIFYKSKIHEIFTIFTKIDSEFHHLNIDFNYKHFAWKVLIELVFVVLFIYGLFVALICHYDISSIDSILSEYLINIHPIFLIEIVLLMFINFCWLIKCKLEIIRLFLIDLSKIDEKSMIETDEIWKVRFVHETPKLFIREIRIIATIFDMLFKTVNILNGAFGVSNLTTLGMNFIWFFLFDVL